MAISGASYDSKSKDVTSGYARGLCFKDDGTKVYVVSPSDQTVHQRTLSTAWDISTAGSATGISIGGSTFMGLFFKSDGTKMYLADSFTLLFKRYTLSTPWDVTTATVDATDTLSFATQTDVPRSMFIDSTGTKLYLSSAGAGVGKIWQYTLSTPWSLASGSYASKSFVTTTQESANVAIFLRPDLTKLYVSGSTNDKVWRYTLSTPGDISTASSDSDSFSVASQENTPSSVSFKSDGSKFYVVGLTNSFVYQYSSGESWSAANIGLGFGGFF